MARLRPYGNMVGREDSPIASARAAILLPTIRPLPSNAPSPPPAPRQSDRATAQLEARAPASNAASTPPRSPLAAAKYFLVLECSAPATNAPQPRAAPTHPLAAAAPA